MLDWMLPEKHAISILKKDHAVPELKIHAVIEEEIFYPAVRKHVGKNVMNEADEEHHVARVLIAELDKSGARRRSP